jgi:hypothetical protein
MDQDKKTRPASAAYKLYPKDLPADGMNYSEVDREIENRSYKPEHEHPFSPAKMKIEYDANNKPIDRQFEIQRLQNVIATATGKRPPGAFPSSHVEESDYADGQPPKLDISSRKPSRRSSSSVISSSVVTSSVVSSSSVTSHSVRSSSRRSSSRRLKPLSGTHGSQTSIKLSPKSINLNLETQSGPA